MTDFSLREAPPEGEQTWAGVEFVEEFEAFSFAAPFVLVRRKATREVGLIEFIHRPRVYFGFEPIRDEEIGLSVSQLRTERLKREGIEDETAFVLDRRSRS